MGLASQRRNREERGEPARSAPESVPYRSHQEQLFEQHRRHQMDLLKIQKTLGVTSADIAAIIAAPMPVDEPAPPLAAKPAPEPKPEPAAAPPDAGDGEPAPDDAGASDESAKPDDKPRKKRGGK